MSLIALHKLYPRTLRSKLVIGYFVSLLLSIIALSFLFYHQVNKNIQDAAKDYLAAEYEAISIDIKDHVNDIDEMSSFLSRRTVLTKGPYAMSYALYDSDAQLIARSQGFVGDESFLEKEHTTLKKTDPNPLSREVFIERNKMYILTGVIKADKPNQNYYLQLGLEITALVNLIFESMRETALIMIPIVLFVVTIGAFYLTHRLLLPISELTKYAEDLSLMDTERRLPYRGVGDELDQLSQTFNRVFERLNSSYQRVVQFTADASHELRLPLTAIKGEAEVVLERERSLDEHRKVLSSIVEEVDRLNHMAGRLLRLARSDSGVDKLEKQNVDLNELFSKMLEFFEPLYTTKNITVHLQDHGPVLVFADKIKLEELVSNLIDNAIKYTPSGGCVDISFAKVGMELQIDIKDTGIGINPSEKKKIFERFYRVDKSRSRSEGGAGLGLSIVEAIVSQHGWTMEVHGSLGKGSLFRIILPATHVPNFGPNLKKY